MPPTTCPTHTLIWSLQSTFFIFYSLVFGWSLMAAPHDDPQSASSYFNWKAPTLGGKQLWTDHVWLDG